MLDWFQRLMPQTLLFFPLFERHANTVTAAAEALRQMLDGGERASQHCRDVLRYEEDADAITRDVLIGVRSTFITPFDRGDIQELITAMDDAIDQMNKTAKTIMLFEVRRFDPQMQQMGDIILQAAKLVLEAMPLLASAGKNAGRLQAITEEIIRIEEQADQLHDQGRKALFLANRNEPGGVMNFMVGTELYDHLESVVDRLEDVSNEINGLVVDQL